ncbi:MAG TPA: PKD domain-containing protein [Patescibacteria group bacterium]|nr:PKD domain-containing protein [Patescibacteria group bacterium]
MISKRFLSIISGLLLVFIGLIFSPHVYADSNIVSWTEKAPLLYSTTGLSAVSVDGKIYAMGGGGINKVQIYDQTTNVWTYGTPIPAVRYQFGLVADQQGKIYAMGGYDGYGVVATNYMYDPITNTWQTKTPMPTSRGDLAVALGNDGKIYTFGGSDTNVVEVYDPISDTWTEKSNMPFRRLQMGATSLSNGKIYLVGGQIYPQSNPNIVAVPLVEEYDPISDTWTEKSNMNTPRRMFGIATENDGRIYAFGGINDPTILSSVESYDPVSDTWIPELNMPTARGELAGVSTNLGNIYAIGGDVAGGIVEEATLLTTDQFPIVSPVSNGALNQGDTYIGFSSFTDPDSTSWTATVDYGDGSGAQSLSLSGMNFYLNHIYNTGGTYTLTVSVTDNQGAIGTSTATITVNSAPTVGVIIAPSAPILVNTVFTASTSFTDTNTSDTHTASWNWGDGNTTAGTVVENNGSGSVSNSHTYASSGVYSITLIITDNLGASGSSVYQYVTAYVSTSSFTGGRSFNNPPGAYPNNSGKVTFGISSKYSNSNVLTGSVKMNFKAANIDFISTSLQSLTTSTGKAYLSGTGTVNGLGNYTFLVTGVDGSILGGSDLVRIRIKDSSNNVIYDSQPGALDTSDPTTSVVNGNIRIH